MNCPKCGREVLNGAMFCTNCGFRLDNLAADASDANIDAGRQTAVSESSESAETVFAPNSSDIENVPESGEKAGAETPPEMYEAKETAGCSGNDAVSDTSALTEKNPDAEQASAPAATFTNDNAESQKTGAPIPVQGNANPFYSVGSTGMNMNQAPKKVNPPVKPLSAWSYIWRDFIFFIPIVNIVAMFIFAFADGINKNSRSFARSRLIWTLIASLILIAGCILLYLKRDEILKALKWLAEAAQALINAD